jgi:predicted metal-dependent enzyme (double-stranded beta helix superfamily)
VVPFDVDRFVADCLAVEPGADRLPALRDLMERAVSEPAPLRERFSVPVGPYGDGILYRSPELVVLTGMFPPGFATGIHDHSAPAVIGVWARHEDNWLYRRAGERIEALDRRRVETGSVLLLGENAIHDVHAPGDGWSGALHVYLGDILTADRSSWPDPGALARPFDGADLEQRWEAAADATGRIGPIPARPEG